MLESPDASESRKLSRLTSCDVNVKLCILCNYKGLGFTVNAVIPLKKSHLQQILMHSKQAANLR